MAREQLKTLTEPMYYILLALNEKRYGYEIMKFIENITNGRVIVGPGTLYALLGRFENENIIKRLSKEERRKNYIITSYGKQILDDERHRLLKLIEDGNEILQDDISIEKDKDEDSNEEKTKDQNKSIFKRLDSDILF